MENNKEVQKTLEDRIKEEMTVNYRNSLEKNFDLASKMLKITPEGNVAILNKEKFTGNMQIALYHVGKIYAREAGLSKTAAVSNKELAAELGLPEGSVYGGIKVLRDQNILKDEDRGTHIIAINRIETLLKEASAILQSK